MYIYLLNCVFALVFDIFLVVSLIKQKLSLINVLWAVPKVL